MTDEAEIAALIAKTFIARRDVKAVQSKSGAYMPVTDTGKQPPEGKRMPWTMGDLKDHVTGSKTYGHYVVSAENTAKVFCFDLDLEKKVTEDGVEREPRWTILNPVTGEPMQRSGDARDVWHPDRIWQWCYACGKGWYADFQEPRCVEPGHEQWVGVGGQPDTVALTAVLQETAFRLANRIQSELEIPVAISYSGNKGLHVYGITGEQPAIDVRMAANLIIESFDGRYAASRGSNFFRDTDADFDAVSIEVFPKQESLDGKDLGNLLRLPLGVNRKSGNRAFFIKHGTYGFLREADPVDSMTVGNPWS